MTSIRNLCLIAASALALPLFAVAQSEDTVVAELNGKIITFGQITEFQTTIPNAADLETQAVLPQLLNIYIDQNLIVVAGREQGLENDPQVKKQLAKLETELIRQAYLRDEISDRVTEELIEAEYHKRMETAVQEDEVKARHILVETQDVAEDLIHELADGADFAALAIQSSTGPSGPQGGDLGWFKEGTMVPEFSAAAFAMQPGEFSKSPVKTNFGWHVILVEDRRLRPLPTLEEMFPQLRDELADKAVQQVITELRSRASIDIKTLAETE